MKKLIILIITKFILIRTVFGSITLEISPIISESLLENTTILWKDWSTTSHYLDNRTYEFLGKYEF